MNFTYALFPYEIIRMREMNSSGYYFMILVS